MPRDNDRGGRGRPPGGERGRAGPSRGKSFAGTDKRGRDGDGPRPPRKAGGRAFRKENGDAPRGERRDDRAGAKRFGGAKSGERKFGDKRPYGSKPGGGFRKDGDRAPRAFDRDGSGGRAERDDRPRFDRLKFDRPKFDRPKFDRPRSERSGPDRPRSERAGSDRPKFDRPKFDRARDDRPARSAEGDRGPRKFDRPKSDRPGSDRPRYDRARDDRPARSAESDRGPRKFDRPKFDRPKFERSRGDRPHGDRPRSDRPRDERPRDERPRGDTPRGERSFRDRPREDRPHGDRPRGDRAGGDRPRAERPFRDRPRGDRPDRDRPRGDRPYDKRPRDDARPGSSRDRGDRAPGDRPRDGQRRNDRVARSSHAWRDHSRNDNPDPSPEPREDTQLGETAEAAPREVQQRPAFGGRGAYRERKPSPRDGRERRDAAPPPPKKSGERIAKLMARAGLCSRREAEEWIRQGRVTVNGRVIDSPALDIVERDIVAVDGAPLPERERTRMFLYHKPRGLVTTHSDPEGRATIFDNLPQDLPRLISIGRLDYNTEGLLLLTNDGGLKRTLELPDTGWLRRYRVRAYGTITQARLDGLRDGIEVDGVKYGPIEATLDSEQGTNVWITFAIREGKNREVRNVLSSLGLEVNRLIRVSYGPFQLGELVEGAVEEIRGRHLRDQLGERIAKQSGADFSLPVREQGEADDEDEAPARPREDRREPRSRDAARPNRDDRDGKPKPKSRVGLIADSKGRRVLVQRVSEGDGERNTGKSRRPPGRYKGKRERGKPEE